jgi:hypothetical protein
LRSGAISLEEKKAASNIDNNALSIRYISCTQSRSWSREKKNYDNHDQNLHRIRPVSVRIDVSVRATTFAGCGMKLPIATSWTFVTWTVGSAEMKSRLENCMQTETEAYWAAGWSAEWRRSWCDSQRRAQWVGPLMCWSALFVKARAQYEQKCYLVYCPEDRTESAKDDTYSMV